MPDIRITTSQHHLFSSSLVTIVWRFALRIVIIGAGRVGCGALGMSFVLQGHEVVFAARRDDMIESINRLGYTVITRGKVDSSLEVQGVRAVSISAREFGDEIARADQIYTSVRPDNLPSISGILAQSLLNRIRSGVTRPVDIFCCENLKNAGSQLERLIFTYVPFQYAQQMQSYISFNAAVSDRIVSGQQVDQRGKFVFTADAVGDILFDTLHIKGDFEILPPLKGIDNFPACIEEKLYILNCGHAATSAAIHTFMKRCSTRRLIVR
jgi:mannitol-1-phosphate 5-dehydrogenase